MSKKTGCFTPKQQRRLPTEGYWLDMFRGNNYSEDIIYCVRNGECKYLRGHMSDWATLLWSCMPTQNQINFQRLGSNYSHYNTIEELISKNPSLRSINTKAPNDF